MKSVTCPCPNDGGVMIRSTRLPTAPPRIRPSAMPQRTPRSRTANPTVIAAARTPMMVNTQVVPEPRENAAPGLYTSVRDSTSPRRGTRSSGGSWAVATAFVSWSRLSPSPAPARALQTDGDGRVVLFRLGDGWTLLPGGVSAGRLGVGAVVVHV